MLDLWVQETLSWILRFSWIFRIHGLFYLGFVLFFFLLSHPSFASIFHGLGMGASCSFMVSILRLPSSRS